MDVESNMGIDCGIKNWFDGGQGFILELTFSPSGKAGRITWGLDDQHQNNTPWQQMLVDDVEGGEEDTDRNNIPMAPRCQRWRSATASTSCAGKAAAATATTSPRPRPLPMRTPRILATAVFVKEDEMAAARVHIMTHTAVVRCC